MRFFLTSSVVYEQFRLGLNAPLGYPNEVTLTSLPVIGEAHVWNDGRILVPVDEAWLTGIEGLAQQIDATVAEGHAEEITAEQYHSSLPPPVLP